MVVAEGETKTVRSAIAFKPQTNLKFKKPRIILGCNYEINNLAGVRTSY